MKNKFKNKQGFTVVELAVVVVIIGLLISSVLVGQSMIRTSYQDSIISDLNSYKAAVNTFELNYGFKPGDMRNASDYWGSTADGNGNGIVDSSEPSRVWEQLSLSEIIKTPYSYAATITIGTNFPITNFDGATFSYGDANFWSDSFFIERAGAGTNAFCLNGDVLGDVDDVCPSPWGSTFLVEDAMAVDLKIDDGVASSGKVIGSSCIDDSSLEFEEFGSLSDDDFDYQITNTNPCGMMFIPKNNR